MKLDPLITFCAKIIKEATDDNSKMPFKEYDKKWVFC